MTSQYSQFPRFYVTAPNKCPYLEGKQERKIFTELNMEKSEDFHASLAKVGFRRSQDIAYRPNCENCIECKSVRIPVSLFTPNRTQRRLIILNDDLVTQKIPNIATSEQFELLSGYLRKRHSDGGMAGMNYSEYVHMVESSPIDTCIIEYRLPSEDGKIGQLIGVTLTDIMSDSLSMVYSFYDVSDHHRNRSIGTYVILDHVARARMKGLAYVYLGYWVKDSPKMAYKVNFRPLEVLDAQGWFLMNNKK